VRGRRMRLAHRPRAADETGVVVGVPSTRPTSMHTWKHWCNQWRAGGLEPGRKREPLWRHRRIADRARQRWP
jgi:hypothetical protein